MRLLTTHGGPFENPTVQRKRSRTTRLSKFSRLLFSEWRHLELPTRDETIVVAVSGGADSTALLLAITELIAASKLSLSVVVAHLDHGLRSSSRNDAKWVSTLALQLGYTPVISHIKVSHIARNESDNLEQAARKKRYEFLANTAKRTGARFVLTGHTMDDQAETVLLRLMRGSASLGLGGMEALRPLEGSKHVQLVRPMLWARRSETEAYCVTRKTEFLHDEMNYDESFARVKVRKQLLPLMESFNKRVVEALSRTASLLREDSTALLGLADNLLSDSIVDLEAADKTKSDRPRLNVNILAGAQPALRRRALKQWISAARGNSRRLEMVHLKAVEKLLESGRGGRTVELPGGFIVKRNRGWLELRDEND
ncbi:MAG: tRNA lysidine(34) synthetase TilS [Blastocatellia bacterium]|nr:MAG: tRNA lysidine(34) synthetase TilS [Blastocatellia bacterium]